MQLPSLKIISPNLLEYQAFTRFNVQQRWKLTWTAHKTISILPSGDTITPCNTGHVCIEVLGFFVLIEKCYNGKILPVIKSNVRRVEGPTGLRCTEGGGTCGSNVSGRRGV